MCMVDVRVHGLKFCALTHGAGRAAASDFFKVESWWDFLASCSTRAEDCVVDYQTRSKFLTRLFLNAKVLDIFGLDRVGYGSVGFNCSDEGRVAYMVKRKMKWEEKDEMG